MFVAPSVAPPVEVEILQLKRGHCSPESSQVGSVHLVIALVGFVEDEVEVPCQRPWSGACIPDSLQFFKEENLVSVLIRLASCDEDATTSF